MINIDKPKPFVLPRKMENDPLVDWIRTDENGQIIVDWDRVPTVNIPFNPAPSIRPLGVQPNNPWIDHPIVPYAPNPDWVNPYNGDPIWIVQPNNMWYGDNVNSTGGYNANPTLTISTNNPPMTANGGSYTVNGETFNWSTSSSNTVDISENLEEVLSYNSLEYDFNK